MGGARASRLWTSPPAGSNKGDLESDRAWFGRAPPAARRFSGTGHTVEAQGLRKQVGVLAQAVAGALNVDDDRMVEQAVQQRGRDDRIAKNLGPLREPAVAGQDHGAAFVAGVDQLKE